LTLETRSDEFARGTTFAGRYEIIEELGKGGMGKVYRVLDKKINEDVALKFIRFDIASDKKTLERFSNELKIARKIVHKNVGRMYHLSEENGTYYVTMEYVPGEDLRSMIRMSRQLATGTGIHIAKQVCDGLAEAHKMGIVHRDLKPGNIMIDKEGNARIMDFGIACSVQTKGITGTGIIIGTPDYMSPEQAEVKDVDGRSDIYSLGVILYEMVTGRLPFEGETPLSIAMKHRAERPKDPRELNAQVPQSLSRVILKCLEKEPAERYQTTDELKQELTDIESAVTSTGPMYGPPRPQSEKITTLKQYCVAVLPFADFSPQRDQQYFCDGLAEEIINALTKIKELKVVARTSVFSFKGKDIDVREIGRQLGVAIVLEGSVRKAADRIRVTAELVDVADGYHLWSERYDRNIEDIFAIQDDITLAIVDSLKINLMGEEKRLLVKHHTQDAEAYNLYLQGRHFWFQRTLDGIQKGMQSFRQAIEKDPNYALAYSGIADCYSNLGFYFLAPQAAFPKAMAAAQKAIELDESLAEGHASRAFIKELYEWDWQGAEREYKRAIELNPEYANAHHWYALYLGAMDRWVESMAEAKKAVDLEPLSSQFRLVFGVTLYQTRLYDQAVQEFKNIIENDPTFFPPHFFLGWWTYPELGKFEEAVIEAQKAVELTRGSSIARASLGYAYAMAGKVEEAKRVLDELEEISKKTYVSPAAVAVVYARLGEIDRAFEFLEKACEFRDHWMQYLRTLRMFDPVRGYPRYNALLAKLKL
jgi:serine/threonine protein kinase/tetratricopeptide (TPR) repeat protein